MLYLCELFKLARDVINVPLKSQYFSNKLFFFLLELLKLVIHTTLIFLAFIDAHEQLLVFLAQVLNRQLKLVNLSVGFAVVCQYVLFLELKSSLSL